jgi:tetratricopeptide (TPR) repeat protein
VAAAAALTFERQPYEEAMLRALEDASEPELRAELYSQLAFETVYRWLEDFDAIEEWIEQALGLAGPQSPARARALIARSYCGDDAAQRAADAIEIVERLPDLRLRAYAFHARADSALIAGDYEEAIRWAERRLELVSELGDPDLLADALWGTVPGYAGLGRFEDARRAARHQDEVTSELTAHHRLHGVAAVLEVEELAGDWRRIAELTERAERAVEDNAAVPCVHNPRSLLVCALAAAYLGGEDEARRLEALTMSLGVEDYGRLYDVRIRLALLRGDLESVARLIADWEQPGRALLRRLKLTPRATRLDAFAALGNRERVEQEASAHLREGTYLEPFALRALGIVRGDEGLLSQATERFRALGLDWHARQTEETAKLRA